MTSLWLQKPPKVKSLLQTLDERCVYGKRPLDVPQEELWMGKENPPAAKVLRR